MTGRGEHGTPAAPRTGGGPAGAASPALWATALLLVAIIILQSGRLAGNGARAEMVSQRGEFTILTADGGVEDVLMVLDARTGSLIVYKMRNARALDLLQRVSVEQMFVDARRNAGGRPR